MVPGTFAVEKRTHGRRAPPPHSQVDPVEAGGRRRARDATEALSAFALRSVSAG
jgi:hypothetical protein